MKCPKCNEEYPVYQCEHCGHTWPAPDERTWEKLETSEQLSIGEPYYISDGETVCFGEWDGECLSCDAFVIFEETDGNFHPGYVIMPFEWPAPPRDTGTLPESSRVRYVRPKEE